MPVVCVLVRDFDLLNIIFMNNRKETRITCGLLDLPGLSQLRDQLSHIFLQNNHTGRTGELFKRGILFALRSLFCLHFGRWIFTCKVHHYRQILTNFP